MRVFLGDDNHSPLQDQQFAHLRRRSLEIERLVWKVGDTTFLQVLDESLPPTGTVMLASRLGALPAIHWASRNPNRVRRLILLHPCLHLNQAEFGIPKPHFVPTLVIHQAKDEQPSSDQVAHLGRGLFHDFSLHLTVEPPDLASSLSLLDL